MTNWQASFITSTRHDASTGAPAPYLRRRLTVDDGLVRATLHVTGLGLVEAHLNGSVVGDEVLAPGWTSYRHRLAVSSHDVTGLLVPGANALGAILGEGWAVGRLGWGVRRNIWTDRPAAFLQLELEYADRVELVGTDATWRAGTGAVLANGLYDGETFDARLEPVGWDEADFDDSGWGDVEVVEWDLGVLTTTAAQPIRRIEELRAREVLTTAAGRTVVDFGQVLTGWVRLTVDGDAGATVVLHTCETLIDGEPEFETNRTALATDRYTLRGGGGPETWEPRFTFHGFRYVDVEGWPGELTPDALTAVVVHSDMPRTGWFECSDERLNQLHRNVVWSMRGNFVGVPTDCPQRDERLGWTGDINAFAPTAAFLYDVRGVLGSWLEDLAAEQATLGGVPMVVPDVLGGSVAPTALWGDVAVSLPTTLYEAYGDEAILERQYPSMAAYVDAVEAVLDEHGVWSTGFQFGDWCDPDAPAGNPGAGKADRHLIATAFLARTTAELADAAAVLGRADDEARYRTLHDRVRAGFRREWVTETGLVADLSPTAYALAICFGLLDPDQEPKAGARLAKLVEKADHRIATGFAGTPHVAEALSRTGHLGTAYALLLEEGCPSFLYPLSKGATTIWERWDAIRPDGTLHRTGMTSLNHYALGAVATWLHRTVAGLAPSSPGYATLQIAPRPGGGLTSASAELDTPHGRARVHWDHGADGTFVLEATVPAGTTAEVVLPHHPESLVVRVGEGDHRWSYPWPRHDPSGITERSTLRDVRDHHPGVWVGVADAVRRHFNIDLEESPEMLDQDIRRALDGAEAASPELGAELRAALAPLLDRS